MKENIQTNAHFPPNCRLVRYARGGEQASSQKYENTYSATTNTRDANERLKDKSQTGTMNKTKG